MDIHTYIHVLWQIGDTILVHGGLRSKHLKYGMQRMNNEMAAWLEGAFSMSAIYVIYAYIYIYIHI